MFFSSLFSLHQIASRARTGWLDAAKSPLTGESRQPKDTGSCLVLRLTLLSTAGGPSGLHSNKSE
jgi:hypothetical protein